MYEPPLLPRTETHSSNSRSVEAAPAKPLLSGPGWKLFASASMWRVRLGPQLVNPAASYADVRRRLGQLAVRLGKRPLLLDLRAAPLLDGVGPRELLARLLGEFEQQGLPVIVVVGPQAIQAVRVHSLILHNAPTCGRCVTNPAEASRWLVGAQADD